MSRPRGGKVCHFWARGDCRNGDSCSFEHPRDARANPLQDAPQSGGFGRPLGGVGRGGGDSYRPGQQEEAPFSIRRDHFEYDFVRERPTWPFSAYGPGRDAPKQLIEGPLEQSSEEMRVLYYLNRDDGIRAWQQLDQESKAKDQFIISNVDAAIKYVTDAAGQPNNRCDQCRAFIQQQNGTPNASQNQTSFQNRPTTFGTPSPQPASGFGQPSSFGQSSGLGRPSFGQLSSFGQPSSFGAKIQHPAFGQIGFGQTSGFPAANNGQTQLPPTFGQPSAFGSGQQLTAFGQPSGLGTASQQPTQRQNGSPFGGGAKVSPFAQNSIPAAFGQPSAPATNPSPFAQQPGTTDTGRPSATAITHSTFSQKPQQQTQQTAPTSALAATNGIKSHLPNDTDAASISTATPDPSTYISRSIDGKIAAWKGHPVTYVGNMAYYQNPTTGKPERCWWTNGPPKLADLRTEAPPEVYSGNLGEVMQEAYRAVREEGRFKDGVMPEIPPKREWVRFDL